MNVPAEEPIWVPSPDRVRSSLAERFRRHLGEVVDVELADSRAVHRFSCEQPGPFWRCLWGFAGLVGEPGPVDVLAPAFASTEFFPDGTVDITSSMLAGDPSEVVVIECNETGTVARIDRRGLRQRVASLAAALRRFGVHQGDVVAGYATTSTPTLTMMLAAAACGAVYTTTSAEFGADAVIDRFSQVEPKVLLAVDHYDFAGRRYDVSARVNEIVGAIESIELVVTTGAAGSDRFDTHAGAGRTVVEMSYDAATADTAAALVTQTVPFNAPGWILYSSGTTGTPKCIVHRAGGVALKHLSEMLLHCDIRRGDRVFYYTTPSWMMWNWLVTALAAGACVVLYDGSPLAPDPSRLLQVAEREAVTYFGTSPSFLDALRRTEIDVAAFDLATLRTVAVTGAPLSPGTARFAASWGADVHVLSKSGGTDLCGGLVTGDPTRAVWGGEIQAPAAGCDIAVVDDAGNDVTVGTTGELVSRTPFPSMPLGFLGDTDGSRLRAAYYDRYPGCWHQADFVSETEHGGYVVHGRSDTTLNANGVRIGTSEIYSQLERFGWIRGASAVEYKLGPAPQVVLVLELADGEALDDDRRAEIRTTLRDRYSPRHVPAVIEAVAELPRTMNGKLSEVAVTDAINRRELRWTGGLANPRSLDAIQDLGQRLSATG